MKLVRIASVAVGVAYLAINLLMYFNQRQLMYIPSLERVSPVRAGLANVEEVEFRNAAGNRLVSWYGRALPDRPTVLFFHGNAGAVYHRTDRFRKFMARGIGVFMLGYPGYGGNAGEPSERAFREASLMAFEFLRKAGIEPGNIVVYGESIGSGVAVHLAASVDAKCLILEAPMSSAIDVARAHYPWLLATLFLRDSFRSIDYIDRIDMPLLVIHGSEDHIIPLSIGRKLFELAREPKTFLEITGAGHNDLQSHATNEIAMEFIESLWTSSAGQPGDQQS